MFKSFFRRNRNFRTVRNGTTFTKSKSLGVLAFSLATGASIAFAVANSKGQAKEKVSPLNPQEFLEFPLLEKKPVSPNTAVYRFKLPSPDQELSLPVASYILVMAKIPGEEKPVVRPYTPIRSDGKGHFDLLVKSYPNGKVSKHFAELTPGDTIKVKGPNVKLEYKPNMKKKIGMIAGGSGITPMLQIIHEIVKNPEDKTEVTLVFGNQTPDDILLKETLDSLATAHKNIKVNYIIDRPHPQWHGAVGYVTDEYVKKVLPPPSDDTLIFVCGPPPMMESISGNKTPKYEQGELKGVLKRLGYTEQHVFKF